jgi:hypothetical protein
MSAPVFAISGIMRHRTSGQRTPYIAEEPTF